MNEYEQVQKTVDEILKVLNESKLSGMTVYYMMKDITGMIEDQLRNPIPNNTEPEAETNETKGG